MALQASAGHPGFDESGYADKNCAYRSIVIFSLVIQSARRKLTAEQLFSLERINRISGHTFLPLAPFLVALPAAYFTELSQRVIFWVAVASSLGLFMWDSWRSHRKLVAAGLPREYVTSHSWGMAVMLVGTVVAMALVAQGIHFKS